MAISAGELDELRCWGRQHAFELTDAELASIHKYLELLELWSERTNLIGSRERPMLVRKHLADCIFAASRCPDHTSRLADLGSGAGMPGIPIAIARPSIAVDLVESRQKKASFLTDATRDLANARVVNSRIEGLRGADYDRAAARALAPLAELLPLARPVLRRGGTLLAMKSPGFHTELEGVDIASTGFARKDRVDYRLPTGEVRVLLEFEAI